MATFIEYSDRSNVETICFGAELTPIGYVAKNPKEVLRILLPEFYVVDYLDVRVPSRSEFDNRNLGLRLSSVADGIGLTGTIKMLEQSELFRSCKHEPFSDEEKKEVVDKIKSRIKPWHKNQEPLYDSDAEKYALVFDVLGFPMSVDELIKFTTHEDYYKRMPTGERRMLPKNLSRFT
ncbi:MAG: hypothetical protein ACMXYE_02990 [Candidatus Woesearchaeota archaeon]